MKTINLNNYNNIHSRKTDQIGKLQIYNQVINNKVNLLNNNINQIIHSANNTSYYKNVEFNNNLIIGNRNSRLIQYYYLIKLTNKDVLKTQEKYLINKSKFISNTINLNNSNNYQIFYNNRIKLQNLNSYLIYQGTKFKSINKQPVRIRGKNKIVETVQKYKRLKFKYYRFVYKYNNYSIKNISKSMSFDTFIYNRQYAKTEYLKKMKVSLKKNKLNKNATAFFNRKFKYFFRQFKFNRNINNHFFVNKQKSKIKNNIYKIINNQYFSEINK